MGTKVAGIGVEAIEYNQESATVRTQFDQEKTSASMTVIATLADVMGVDPVELDPLHATVDPDALDSLVRVHNRTCGDIHVTFSHESHAITVYSYGVVAVSPDRNPTAEISEKETGE